MVGEREETSEGRRKGSKKEKRRERGGKNRTSCAQSLVGIVRLP